VTEPQVFRDYARGTVSIMFCPTDSEVICKGAEAGPIAIPWAEGGYTDAEARGRYFEDRAQRVLYGVSADSGAGLATSRCSWTFEKSVDKGYEIEGLELLSVAVGSLPKMWLAVVHVRSQDVDGLIDLYDDLVVPTGSAAGYDATTDTALSISVAHLLAERSTTAWTPVDGGRRQSSAMHVTPRVNPDSDSVSPEELLWRAASLLSAPRFPWTSHLQIDSPNPDSLSADWQMQVLRDGAGFIWEAADESDPKSFHAASVTLVRSIYTDILILAFIQRSFLDLFSNELSCMDPDLVEGTGFRNLLRGALTFRNQIWWEDITRAALGARIFSRAQEQLATSRLFDRLTSDLSEFRSTVTLQELSALRVAETKREEHFRSFERKVKIFASIAVSLSLLFAILSVDIYNIDSLGWIDQDDEGLPWQLVLSMTVAVAALSGLVAALLTRPNLGRSANTTAIGVDLKS
jgi:hypothetical protein